METPGDLRLVFFTGPGIAPLEVYGCPVLELLLMQRTDIAELLVRVRGLALFRGIRDAPAVQHYLTLLEALSQERPDADLVAGTFGRLWKELSLGSESLLPDAWQSYLVGCILDDENSFTLGVERGAMNNLLMNQACLELRTLRSLFELDAGITFDLIDSALPGLTEMWVPWSKQDPAEDSARRTIAQKLAGIDDWGVCAELLADYYARNGAGSFGRYQAFRWGDGRIQPVPHPDPVRLAELIGYDAEQEQLIRNTRRLITGLPSHHVLLYGLPGTGKSSTVKALVNEYSDNGLRLVEVSKDDLRDLSAVLHELQSRGPSFIVFIDDLSFEEHEVEYKSLKALLQGSVEEPPANVRIYATSNRRNLIRESFSDRDEVGSDDVHARDTMQEKLSLAARFGLRVTFPAPDQREYLTIVRGLVQIRNIKISDEELTERALFWDQWHAGRSGRSARQFVLDLEADLAEDQ
ncbi:ATP-binding protein [soil metagenome]